MSKEQIEKMTCEGNCVYYKMCYRRNVRWYSYPSECPCFEDKADYRKQSEGEWIYKFSLDGDRFYECSVCGRQEVVNCLCKERNLAEDRPYCHCGAKMKGGAE